MCIQKQRQSLSSSSAVLETDASLMRSDVGCNEQESPSHVTQPSVGADWTIQCLEVGGDVGGVNVLPSAAYNII